VSRYARLLCAGVEDCAAVEDAASGRLFGYCGGWFGDFFDEHSVVNDGGALGFEMRNFGFEILPGSRIGKAARTAIISIQGSVGVDEERVGTRVIRSYRTSDQRIQNKNFHNYIFSNNNVKINNLSLIITLISTAAASTQAPRGASVAAILHCLKILT
jgi:hypothetical protein